MKIYFVEKNLSKLQRNLITSEGVFLQSKSSIKKMYSEAERRKFATNYRSVCGLAQGNRRLFRR